MCLCGELYVPVSLCYTVCALVSGASLLLVHPSPNRIYSRQSLLRGSAPVAHSSVGKRQGDKKSSFESTGLCDRDFLVSCAVIFFILRKVASVL